MYIYHTGKRRDNGENHIDYDHSRVHRKNRDGLREGSEDHAPGAEKYTGKIIRSFSDFVLDFG